MIKPGLLGETYIADGSPAPVSDFIPDMSAEIYYEVIRMIGGKLLFLEDHLARLEHSLSGSGIPFPGKNRIRESLLLLKRNNAFSEGNIRICIQQTVAGSHHLYCYFVPYLYPEICMYKSGVQVMTFPHVRPNPGIKKWDDRFRTSVSRFISENGIYEAILLNHRNEVTEGSRSNVFFITSRNQLVSAPEEDILPGITRRYILEICRAERIEVIHRPVRLEELHRFEACFISGTSPKVLPVWKLDGVEFEVGQSTLQNLMDRFEGVIRENLEDPDQSREQVEQ